MKRFIYMAGLAVLTGLAAGAQEQTIRVTDKHIEKSGDALLVDMTLDLSDIRVSSGRSVQYVPVIRRGDSTCVLPALILNGRNRQILYERTGRTPEKNGEYAVRRKNGTQQSFDYHTRVPYATWMSDSRLEMAIDECGCGWDAMSSHRDGLFDIRLQQPAPKPLLAYIAPQTEIKNRSKSGSAFLDFPVGQTTIRPDYRSNPSELEKIRETVESVQHDDYATIRAVTIKGFASPEGSYASNERLAKGRSQALADYVKNHYGLQGVEMRVDYEPEDWAGLEQRVAQTGRSDKEAVLRVIRDGSISDPDRREEALKQLNGGETYRYLLQEIYPALRHSDYTVEYTIRALTLSEAKELIYRDPKQLSLEEMFQVAQSYEAGSPEFKEVFEIAVRMYPDDPVSNLNAANSALLDGKVKAARRYLEKTPDTPQKRLAEAVAAWLDGDTEQARQQLQALASDPAVGHEAQANLNQLSIN